jgi:hypothetical protein
MASVLSMNDVPFAAQAYPSITLASERLTLTGSRPAAAACASLRKAACCAAGGFGQTHSWTARSPAPPASSIAAPPQTSHASQHRAIASLAASSPIAGPA